MNAEIAELSSLISSKALQDYFRCPELPAFGLCADLGSSTGFLRFAPDLVCYGRTVGETHSTVNGQLFDASAHARIENRQVLLPFDITEVVDNLRYESYVQSSQRLVEKSWVKEIYYGLRP